MLIALLAWCLVGAARAQDNGDQKPQDETPAVIYDTQWTSDGQYSLLNPQSYGTGSTRPDNQDFAVTYWRPYSTSSLTVNGESIRGREEGVDGFDYGPVSSPALQPTIDDSNATRPFVYPLQSTDEKREVIQSSLGSTTNFPVPEFPQSVPPAYPMFYSPGLSMNVRRRYTNDGVDALRPAQNASEQVTSSYEETFTRVIPPAPIPGVPMSPDRLLPYSGGFGYPMQYFPYPGFAPPPPPASRDETAGAAARDNAARYFSRDAGAGIAPALEEQQINPRSVPVQDAPGFYYGPQNMPNPYLFPFLQPGLRNQAFQGYMGPAPMLDRYRNGRPIPALRVPPVVPEEEEAANEVVPPNFLPPAFQRFPFAWRPPIVPNFFPGFVPPPPARVPDARDLPVDGLPVPVAPVAGDRLPLDANVEALPLLPTAPFPPAAPLPPTVPLPPEKSEASEIANKLDGPNSPVRTPYEFGYDMNDGKGTDQHRMEVSNGAGEVRGSYGYRDLFGVYRLVNYVADKNGFRAFVKSNEPGVASAGSADVIVQAEVPPPHAVEESLRAAEPQAVVVPSGDAELIDERV